MLKLFRVYRRVGFPPVSAPARWKVEAAVRSDAGFVEEVDGAWATLLEAAEGWHSARFRVPRNDPSERLPRIPQEHVSAGF